ncbi:hypothetical protein GQ457_13G015700 [Hibiscus cannabinus]
MTNNTISLRSLLEKEKLNGINFLDWFRNMRIVFKQERKEYVIEEAVPNDPGANAPRADKEMLRVQRPRKHQSRMSAQIFPATAEGRIKQEGIKRIRIFSNIPKGSVFQWEGRD